MEKPIYGFFISLFNVVLVWIVFANFLGWSGGAINLTGVSVDWENSYIGFNSLLSATKSFEQMYSESDLSQIFGYQKVLEYTNNLINYVLLGIPQLIEGIRDFNAGDVVLVVPIVIFIATLIAQPVLIIAYSIMILGCVIYFITCFITIFFMFIGGAFNIPYEDSTSIWSQWDYLSELGRYVKVV